MLKTDEPSDRAQEPTSGGVVLGLSDEPRSARAYDELAAGSGRDVLVCATARPGVELSVGLVRDPQLGPLVVVAAGGMLAELLTDRAVALPPLTTAARSESAAPTADSRLLDGWRGAKPSDLAALVDAVVAVSTLAVELGDRLAALDVNPVIAGPSGAVAVDALDSEDRVDLADRLVDLPGAGPAEGEDRHVAGAELEPARRRPA